MTRLSPPTDRVVGVLNLLASADRPLSAAEMGRRLGITPSTCSSLLGALAMSDYVERASDRTYRLGPGLLPLAEAVEERFPLLGRGRDELRRLAADVNCGITLTRILDDHLRVVSAVSAESLAPLGVTAGDEFPLTAPYGAIAMAWYPDEQLDRWLEGWPTAMASPADQAHERQVMAGIRDTGIGVWSLESYAVPLVSRIRSIIGRLADDSTSEQLRMDLTELFAVFGRRGYTRQELLNQPSFSIGYALAAVFGPDRRPRYQIDLHVLRRSVTRREVLGMLRRLEESAATLTALLGGQPPSGLRGGPFWPERWTRSDLAESRVTAP